MNKKFTVEDPVASGVKVMKAGISKLAAGTAHTYTVKAYVTVGDKTIESKGVSVEGITVPGKVTTLKLTTKSKTVTATWNKVTGTGYNVQIATDKNFKKIVKKVTTTKLTNAFTALKKGTTYYVRVQVYKKSKTTQTGAWSAVKSIKCK